MSSPRLTPFLRRVDDAIARHALLRRDQPVLVALSGGADSVALLVTLRQLGFTVEAAHCNFHLRGAESERDAAFVEALCSRLGVPLHRADFETATAARRAGVSVEMQARSERYAFFDRLLDGSSLQAVAVAHHRDDNAETILLNLLRGTGIRGLTGIPRRNGRIVRPLLDVSREEILTFLAETGETYVTDSTNTDTAFRRNRVRHEILPLLRTINPSVEATLAETATRLAETAALAESAVATWTEKAVTPLTDGISIDIPTLLSSPAPRTLLFELLRPKGFTPSTAEEIFSGLNGAAGAWYDGGDFVAVRDRGRIEVRKRPVRFDNFPIRLNETATLPDGARIHAEELAIEQLDELPRRSDTACLDADKLSGALHCRSVREGDRFRPFGMRGSRLVSDYLTDRKRTRIDKLGARVVEDEDGIVWLVGERPDERCRVDEETRRVVVLRWLGPQ